MNRLKYIILNIYGTLLRVLPLPYKPGLIKIGNPNKNSDVLLTCNYYLTVERVKRALKGIDCYLLIANSKGVNVWCGASGGLFTNNDVIHILKTSGIEKLVNHRKIILPQLAASGIETDIIRKDTGWEIIWGPVYAKNIPQFINNKFQKSPKMREVKFYLTQRIEMAIAWAFPVSAVIAIIMSFFWPKDILPVISFIWTLTFLLFITFPAYSRLLNSKGKRLGFIFFDFGHGGFQLVLWFIFIIFLLVYSVLFKDFTWEFISRWSTISFVFILILSIDLLGSAPDHKSNLHKDRLLTVSFNKNKCRGAGLCEKVCPKNCFKFVKRHDNTPSLNIKRCIQCGACIIQCPSDALCYKDPQGKIIPPETIRRFKLNLMGKRLDKCK